MVRTPLKAKYPAVLRRSLYFVVDFHPGSHLALPRGVFFRPDVLATIRFTSAGLILNMPLMACSGVRGCRLTESPRRPERGLIGFFAIRTL